MNESKSLKKTKVLVGMAIFTALVVVLQLMGGVIKIGMFSPSLVLIPIVIGAAVYGAAAGAWLGFVFGAVVFICCVTGADFGGNAMFVFNPFVTALICLGKGTAAGWLAALVFRALQHKNSFFATVVAAIVCPVVNTGLFCLGAVAVFKPLLLSWAASVGYAETELTAYVFVVLIGLNFLLEVLINALLSPVVVRILKIRKIA